MLRLLHIFLMHTAFLNYNHILALDAFIQGKMVVQDVSSMLVAEVADPKKGDYVIDVCAAPGGKRVFIWETRWRDMEQ